MEKDKVTIATSEKKHHKGRKKQILLISMCAPTALWLIVLRYLPMFGIVMAFKGLKNVNSVITGRPTLISNILYSDWVGFSNFKALFATNIASIMIRNTVLYNVVFILVGMFLSITFAIMLNELTNKFVAKAYQTLMFFPYFISWVVASYFVAALIDYPNGMITRIINNAGGNFNSLQQTGPWPAILVAASAWKNTGYSTILYLATITGIDQSLFEAAAIDGATKWQQIKYITIPQLKAMVTILLIMDVGRIFSGDFGLFKNVPQGSGPLQSVTEIIDTYTYSMLMGSSARHMERSTATGLLQNVVGFILIMLANEVVKKIEPENSLF